LTTVVIAVAIAPFVAVSMRGAAAGAASSVYPVVGTQYVGGAYCVDTTDCLAVADIGGINQNGFSAYLVTYQNGAISTQGVPGVGDLQALTCPTLSTCYAVGAGLGLSGVIVPIVYGVQQPKISVSGVRDLTGVACDPGTTNCVAVGTVYDPIAGNPFTYTFGVAVPFSGTTASSPQIVNNFSRLSSVACPTAGNCLAVGTYTLDPVNGPYHGGVLPITGGTVGTPQVLSSPNALNGIACESTTMCWAGGASSVVPISGGVAGTAVAVAGVTNLSTAAACPSHSTCYLGGLNGSTGAIVPVSSDVPGSVIPVSSLDALRAVACVSAKVCVATGSVFQNGVVGALVTGVLPGPPPTISSVVVSGTAAKPVVTVTGKNFGSTPPVPSPLTKLSCVPKDASYDYAAGMLSFSDTTAGWTAGSPGSCVGVAVTLWSATKVVFTLGAAYVYPFVRNGDAVSVSLLGATGGTTSSLPNAPAPAPTEVSVSGSGASTQLTITGKNLGSGPPPPNPTTPLSCTAGDTSHDFGTSSLYFSDDSRGWAAGQTGDCLGLTVVSWSSTSVVLGFGAFYPSVSAAANGDSYTLGLFGTTFSSVLGLPPPPTVTSVVFGGSGAALSITVSGHGFGSTPPSPSVTSPCGFTGNTYNAGTLDFMDSTQGWTAGENGDCIGITISSWTNTKVILGLGSDYANYGAVTTGDSYQLQILGATVNATV
jgi:hypothetical protein